MKVNFIPKAIIKKNTYKLYPNNLVFMDGRYEEVYDNNLINEMGNFFLAKEPEKFLKKYVK